MYNCSYYIGCASGNLVWRVNLLLNDNSVTFLNFTSIKVENSVSSLAFDNNRDLNIISDGVMWSWDNKKGQLTLSQMNKLCENKKFYYISQDSEYIVMENGSLFEVSRNGIKQSKLQNVLCIFCKKYFLCKNGKILQRNVAVYDGGFDEFCFMSNVISISELDKISLFLLEDGKVFRYSKDFSCCTLIAENISTLKGMWLLDFDGQLLFFDSYQEKTYLVHTCCDFNISEFFIVDFIPIKESTVVILGANNEFGALSRHKRKIYPTFSYSKFDMYGFLPTPHGKIKSARK